MNKKNNSHKRLWVTAPKPIANQGELLRFVLSLPNTTFEQRMIRAITFIHYDAEFARLKRPARKE